MSFRISSLTKKSTVALFLFTLAGWAVAGGSDVLREIPLSDGTSIKITRDAIRDAIHERPMVKGQLVVVDTRDRRACEEVRRAIEDDSALIGASGADATRLCDHDPERPLASVMVMRNMDREEFRREIDFSPLTSTDRTMMNETRNVAYAMVGAMGVLYLMPESVTKWDREELNKKSLVAKYKENVGRGPVIDKDEPVVNYVGHPLSGAAYYTLARHAGLSKLQSFGYSVVMSTFFWEYGVEAFAEIPSIQDLIITPVVGSLIGELFFNLEQEIEANGGVLWGSHRLGRFAMVLLNPLGNLSSGINRMLGSRVIKEARAEIVTRPPRPDRFAPADGPRATGSYLGIHVRFTF